MTTSQTTISWGIRLVLGLFIGSCLTGNVLTPTTLAQDPALDVVDLHYDRFTGLEQAISIVVSPDSADLYTASPADHAVGVFHRDATTGEVAFIAAYKDGEADVTGLQGVNSLAMAPLGTHVYATSGLDNAVAVFSRNASTGTLTFVEMVADGENGVDGLSGVQAAVISPDGAHLYTVSQGEHALAVFTRNGDTGALTFVEAHYDAIDSVDGLYYANAVAVSPDGAYVYATGCYDHALAVFSRAPETGRLNFAQVLKNGDNGVDGLNFARSVTVSADGHNVYAIGLNAIAVFERDPDTGELIFVEAQKDGVNDVNGLSGANTVTISPNGFSVYVTGAVDDAVAIFERDSATGALTFLAMQHDGTGDVTGLDGARSVAVSPDNSQVYVVSNRDHGLTVFDRDAATGTLSHAATLDDGVGSPNPVMGLDGAKSLAFSPDTRQVYVAGSNNTQDDSRQDAVAVFSRNIATGALTFIDAYADGANGGDALNGVNAVVVSPDGRHVYAMGAYDDAVTIFSRHDSTGALTFIGTVTEGEAGVSGLDWPVFLAISPDGAHLYVKGPNTIVAFERNPATGTLLFVEKKVKGEDGVSGIYGYSSQVMVSPDGAHVFVAGDNDNAFAVFGRDTATGALSFIEYHQDGAGEIDGLAGVRSVIVSPDGAHVYAAGYSDQAIALFGRDSGTGQLTFLEAREIGGDGLFSVQALAIDTNGTYVYATDSTYHAVAVFQRTPATGALAFVEIRKNADDGVAGLAGARAVAVSADTAYVYVTGETEDALAVFKNTLAPPPDIHLAQDETDIPNVSGSYTFDPITTGGRSAAITFTIHNHGPVNLILGDIQTGGSHPNDFNVTPPLVPLVTPDASTTFTVTFAPTASGQREATLSIANTDSDENPYTFTVTGTGVEEADNSYLLWTK